MTRKLVSLAGLAAALVLLYSMTAPGNRLAGAQAGGGAVALASLAPNRAAPVQSCADGSVSATGCRQDGVQVARGNECPAASGEYCSDEFPYCCGTPGNYYCATDVNHC